MLRFRRTLCVGLYVTITKLRELHCHHHHCCPPLSQWMRTGHSFYYSSIILNTTAATTKKKRNNESKRGMFDFSTSNKNAGWQSPKLSSETILPERTRASAVSANRNQSPVAKRGHKKQHRTQSDHIVTNVPYLQRTVCHFCQQGCLNINGSTRVFVPTISISHSLMCGLTFPPKLQ